ncbi:aspartate aminotransferase [Richelia intracellularis HH01]|uniref:Aspartate aminotransferase n=2 Tax=Richelia TaxID=98443 RepID=M1X4Z1_9NOST|nr:aspartate aminotransferase [Richelia intracellularis HH01]
MMARNHQVLCKLMELKVITIEFYRLLKFHNMTRWRVSFVVGNPKRIKSMYQVKTNVDSGVFKAIQKVAIEAFDIKEEQFKLFVLRYQNSRDVIYHRGTRSKHTKCPNLLCTLGPPVSKGYTSTEFTNFLLNKCATYYLVMV